MPNWCMNAVVIRPLNEDDAALLQRIVETRAGLLNALVPMPDAIRNTTSPQPDPDLGRTLTELYGYADWYNWAVGNWGTKWDPSDIHAEWRPGEGEYGTFKATFSTAWSPPLIVGPLGHWVRAFESVLDRYYIEAAYWESGMRFCGYRCNGEQVEDGSPNSPDDARTYFPEADKRLNIAEDMEEWARLAEE